MLRRLSWICASLSVCIIFGCGNHRSAYDNALKEQSLETENLLSNAEHGSAADKYDAGQRYEKGVGVPQNFQEAVRWYRFSAMEGNREAQYKLCEFLERGRGMPQDYQEALRWCGLAADQGHGRAMFMLGRLYHTAHGVPRDVVRAHMWYNLATAHGYEEAKKWRDRLAEEEMSANQIAEAQKLAREWSVRMSSRNG
ncbi:MAG TPA: tetratricopeptide repeat protein [Nitrospira sp.]|nr:tetratricopeptide repeat protein [Nitrospira sp.]